MPNNVVMSLWVAYFDSWCEEEYFYVRADSILDAISEFMTFCLRTNCAVSDMLICEKFVDIST